MFVPKIVSPRGMLLLAIGVAISAGFASSKSNLSVSLLETHAAEPFTVTKPEECVLILESNVVAIFTYNGKTFNGRPVYQMVKPDGGWTNRYIFCGYKKQWSYGARTDSRWNWRFGYATSDSSVCPHEGAVFRYAFSRKFPVTGKIYRAKPPTWTMCRPVKNVPVPASVTSTKTLPATPSLTECARSVMGAHPDATGAQWEKDKCVALFGFDLKVPFVEGPAVTTKLACVFQCNLMPGAMNTASPGQLIRTAETIQQCVGSVRSVAPKANAVTYSTGNKTCTAETDGRHPQLGVGTGVRTCWIGTSTPIIVPNL